MARKILITILIFYLKTNIINLIAQSNNINIIPKCDVNTILSKHIEANKKQTYEGYRIQIFFESGANSKDKAITTKASFDSLMVIKKRDETFAKKFPDTRSYIIYQEPNFKIRVGNFKNSYEAMGLLNEIINVYPNSFIIKDEIELPILKP